MAAAELEIFGILEKEHSKRATLRVLKYIGGDRRRFKELLKIFMGPDPELVQRAAWVVGCIGEDHPDLILQHLPELLLKMNESGVHGAVRRNVLRALQEIQIPGKLEGKVLDACFRFIRDPAEAIAVRAFAITVASRICKKYPELAAELNLTLAELIAMPHSPALSVRAKRAVKEFSARQKIK